MEKMYLKPKFLLVIFMIVYGIFHLLFLWLNTGFDTHMFNAFTMFLRTGVYHDPRQLGYQGVMTGSPPLYSVLLTVLYSIPNADIVLHAIQIIMVILTGLMLFRILENHTPEWVAVFCSLIYLMLPGTVIFTTLVLSDIGGQFFYTVYFYLLYRYLRTDKIVLLSLSVPVAAILGLWRYSFIVFVPVSLTWFLLKRSLNFLFYVPPVIGIAIVTIWIVYQHSLSGVWGIANDPGFRYSIQMMMRAKKIPDESHPSMREIRKYVPPDVDLKRPFWEYEQYILPHVNYDYAQSIRIIGDVGKAAIFAYPLDFLKVSTETFIKNFADRPFAEALGTFDQEQTAYPKLDCNVLQTIRLCRPIVLTKISYRIWNSYIAASTLFYRTIFPILSYCIFLPCLVILLFTGKSIERFLSLFFLIGYIPIALSTWPDARYLVPFYPQMIAVSVLGLKRLRSIRYGKT